MHRSAEKRAIHVWVSATLARAARRRRRDCVPAGHRPDPARGAAPRGAIPPRSYRADPKGDADMALNNGWAIAFLKARSVPVVNAPGRDSATGSGPPV
jgi:hypothetical protein